MIRALGNPTYRRLFLAQVVALAGTGLATVALGLLAYDLAGSRAGAVLGTAFAIKMVAYVFVAPLAQALVSRLPRRAVMVGAGVLRLGVAFTLPFVGEIWQVYVLIFVLQAASATFTPTFQSVIPDVLPDERDFTSALSLSRLAYDLESVLSPVIAGALLLFIPASALFFGTAVGFAGSAVLVAATLVPRRFAAPEAAPMAFGTRVQHGIRLFISTRQLRPVLALNLVVAAAGAFVIVQTVVIVRSTFEQGDVLVPVLLAVNGAGSMVAALLLTRVLERATERRVMLTGAWLLTAAMMLVPIALSTGPATGGLVLVAALWFAAGLGWSAAETPVGRLIRRHVRPDELPAAFAAQFSLSHACWLLTYPLAGWLGVVGLVPTSITLAVIAAGATVTAMVLWPTGTGGVLRPGPAADIAHDSAPVAATTLVTAPAPTAVP
ncbi:MFS transporter [Pengzhenrongella frigida]|uniref:MFS transporter n=1 Tax=Pengzhenrongella frigida TaxID=1259133 RepID=A0A4Q5MVC8_9MICO|nr:MFS transporter [Cellulomonas sp. HLT2-17]RYV49552.1 MFS transporter [Cellulomonas sp. HLT2-17]